jgi:hypothetical protein
VVNRILRDDPSKGDMHNRQGLSFRMLWECLTDYHMWFIYAIGLTWLIPTQPMTAYLTLQLRSTGFDTFETNLLTVCLFLVSFHKGGHSVLLPTMSPSLAGASIPLLGTITNTSQIPAYVLFILGLLLWTWLSERFNSRFLVALVSQIWVLPLLIALLLLPAHASAWSRWVLATLMVGHPYVHAILVAITSRNAGSVRTRTVATALYNMCVQASSIIAQNIYREDDKPLYRRGNKFLIGICCFNFLLFAGAKVFYVVVNRRRERVWGAMSREEKDEYLRTTTDKGNKRLDFRFAH